MELTDLRHLLRRLCFASTPRAEAALRSLDAGAAFAALWDAAAAADQPGAPEFLRVPWTNTALRYAALDAAVFDARRAEQLRAQQLQIDQVRRAWIEELALGPAPLRENLTLFFHDLYGSSSAAVEIPHALAARTALLRSAAMTSVPELLERLVVDPAMMIQIGMDGHGPDRVSDRPAKLILEHWTVGAGAYTDADVGELSRALTGWSLRGDAPAEPLDPRAPLASRRTGIVPYFDAARFEAGAKTLLGETADFDARSALRFLALRPATARRFGRRLIDWLGIADPDRRLEARLESAYLASGGSVRAVFAAAVGAEQFWSAESRWSLIKSPAHLAAGACRQLALESAPVAEIDRWLTSCGQPLLDTPNNGEGGWPGQAAWITPADRLALRYELSQVLGPALERAPPAAAAAWLERLDAAPGVDLGTLRRRRDRSLPELIMTTPQYQLA